MTTFTYTTNIPDPPNAPSVDVPKMQVNTNSVSGLVAVDHIGFGVPNGGAHNQCQISSQSSVNGAIPSGLIGNGFETLYSSVKATSGELYFVRGANPTGIQLTGPGTPQTTTNGYTFLPGGLLIQWGTVSTTSSSGTVTFATANIAFPNACFSVQTTAKYNSGVGVPGSQANYAPDSSSLSSTSFSWTLITSSSSWRGFYWVAIGN